MTDSLIQEPRPRLSPVRSAVLSVLLGADGALSHSDVLEKLQSVDTFDRVTVYRALDWLAQQGLVHKVAGAGRAWRFQATRSETMHRHAHFHCKQCGKTFCLPEVEPILPREIPANFLVEAVELNIKGVCGACREVS